MRNCPRCSNEMVMARATNFGEEYPWCRTCKMELKEIEAAPVEPTRTIGRFSCSEPNIQELPRTHPAVRAVRNQKVAKIARLRLGGMKSTCQDNGVRFVHWVRPTEPACQCGDYTRKGDALNTAAAPVCTKFIHGPPRCLCSECAPPSTVTLPPGYTVAKNYGIQAQHAAKAMDAAVKAAQRAKKMFDPGADEECPD